MFDPSAGVVVDLNPARRSQTNEHYEAIFCQKKRSAQTTHLNQTQPMSVARTRAHLVIRESPSEEVSRYGNSTETSITTIGLSPQMNANVKITITSKRRSSTTPSVSKRPLTTDAKKTLETDPPSHRQPTTDAAPSADAVLLLLLRCL